MKNMDEVKEGEVLWIPEDTFSSRSRMASFISGIPQLRYEKGMEYQAAWKWSVERPQEFWPLLIDRLALDIKGEAESVVEGHTMPYVHWFKGTEVNYADSLLSCGEGDAIIYVNENGERRTMSRQTLRHEAKSLASTLKRLGVGAGDRVACYMPNRPEAIISLAAAAGIGAIFSSCSPDMGSRSVIDRFGTIKPKVLIAAREYEYGGKKYLRHDVIEALRSSVDSIESVIVTDEAGGGELQWNDCVKGDEIDFQNVPFEHPLWILYSSGTTGAPKGIVQSHGGILLEHAKLLMLHHDLRKGDRFFWYTTTGWMMWNVLASSLLAGATAVLYDGAAFFPDPGRLWELAEKVEITVLGTSAPFISASMKEGISPGETYRLNRTKNIAYTGSPLSPAGFQWIYSNVREDIWLTGVSGGTDVCTAFLCGCPMLPVKAGMMQCRALGADVHAFNEEGRDIIGEVGELVLTSPMPSMPIFLWNDRDGGKYIESYFSVYPGAWRHGDWVKFDADGHAAIYGRSDATLKRQGVRIGTSEIYGCVEELPYIREALAVGLERGQNYKIVLFVSMQRGSRLAPHHVDEMREKIRRELSPRHVPDIIMEVPDIPKTLNGKKMEIPVKRILMGQPLQRIVNTGSVSNPDSLSYFQMHIDEILSAAFDGGA
ncbi:MAG: acetoacetate--CoA ligase [Methanomassiliicoccales archaeon]